jgi:hypothetical protein
MPISLAIREFGRDAFTVDILQECLSKEDLTIAEVEWTMRLNSYVPYGYNLNIGYKKHPLTREKLSRAFTGRSITWKEKISATMRGRPATQTQADALARGRRIPRSPESLGRNNSHRKLSDAEVRMIRKLCAEKCLSQEKIGRMFGVKQVAVSRIFRRVSFAWLPEEEVKP